ncbi:MAG: hypothetical protein ACI3W7_05115 [Oscillospiraceae bacterium]
MKPIRILSVFLALCLVLSGFAFASGEASGGGSGNPTGNVDAAYIAVVDGAVADDMLIEPGLAASFDENGADGLILARDAFTNTMLYVSGGDSVFTLTNSYIRKGVDEATADETPANGVVVSDGTLFVDKSYIEAAGAGTDSDYGIAAYGNATLVFNDSILFQSGKAGAMGLNDSIEKKGGYFAGTARGTFLIGRSNSYFYNSTEVAEGWAAISTDSAQGLNVICYNNTACALHGGYAIYADTSCYDYLYGSELLSAEYGAVLTNNGELHLYAGSAATEDFALAYFPEDGETTDAGSSIVAGRNCVWVHCPDMQGSGSDSFVTVFTAEDSRLVTDPDWDARQTLLDYEKAYGRGIADYVDFQKGAIFCIYSAAADIDLTRCELESSSDTILMTTVNNDPLCPRFIRTGGTAYATTLTMTDMDAAGDVKNYDYQRPVVVTLSGAAWSGAAETWSAGDWDGYWAYAEGLDNVNWVNLSDEYDKTTRGTTVELTDGSVWTVTGDSLLERLVIGADCEVMYGTAAVNGENVTLMPGNTYEGEIVITAA